MKSILELELADHISVFELQTVLYGIHEVYFSALWLDLADSTPPGTQFPDKYVPTLDEEAWIVSLQIGTPNKLTVVGRTGAIALAATFISALLSPAVTEATKNITEASQNVTEMIKNKQEIEKIQAEIKKIEAEKEKIEAETNVIQFEIREKSKQLHDEKKISKKSLNEKNKLVRKLEDSKVVIPAIVKSVTTTQLEV